MSHHRTSRACVAIAWMVTFTFGCDNTQQSGSSFAGLPTLDRSGYSQLPNPEPPSDYAALVGVSESNAPNDRLLGWLGHLDREPTDVATATIDAASIESLGDGAEIFDCAPFAFDEQLRSALDTAPDLKWLRAGRKTTSSDLEWICGLTTLRALSLENAELSNANLELLGQLDELRWLVLDGAKLPNLQNGSLPKLPKLEVLSMRYCEAGDSYAPHDGQFPNLRAVCFADTNMTDTGVRQLVAANPKLRYLHLFGCLGVTGNSAVEIGKLKQLRYTHLGYTKLSDDLYETWDNRDGLPRLQILIPNCYIGIGS